MPKPAVAIKARRLMMNDITDPYDFELSYALRTACCNDITIASEATIIRERHVW